MKNSFRQAVVCDSRHSRSSCIELRSGREVTFAQLFGKNKRKFRALLALCEIIDVSLSGFSAHDRQTAIEICFGRQLLPNIKALRTWEQDDDGHRTVHFIRRSERFFPWRDRVRELVFVVRKMTWRMEGPRGGDGLTNRLKDMVALNAVTFIYLLEEDYLTGAYCDTKARAHLLSSHERAFCKTVNAAWSKRMAVTVVNASSLNEVDDDIDIFGQPSDGPRIANASAVDSLRKRVIAAVSPDYTQPGPVCPVHFVTLDEYRAHVGDEQYTIDTGKGWLPQTYSN